MSEEVGKLRSILIVSATFFPDPMVASQRMTHWSRWLPEYGWKPIIACRHYGYEAAPDILAQKVNPHVVVNYLNAAPDSSKIAAQEKSFSLSQMLKTIIAKQVYSPDASARFWSGAAGKIRDLVRQYQPELILSTAPPYGIHCSILPIIDELKIPWVADFREAFIADKRYRPKGLSSHLWPKYLKYEHDVYEKASLIIHQLPVHERWARRKHKFAANRCVTMINGYSDEVIDHTVPPAQAPWGRQSIRVVGTCLDSDALRLAEAVARLVRSGYDLELRIVGRWPDTLPQMQRLLGDRVVTTGFLRYDRAVAEILGADVLVNFLSRERQTGLIISTKLIEYIATGKPVVEVNPTLSDIQFTRGWPQVVTTKNDSEGAVAEALKKALSLKAAISPERLQQFRTQFSWHQQTKKVAEWFDAVANRQPVVR